MATTPRPAVLVIEDNEQLVKAYQDMFSEEVDLAVAYDGITGIDLALKRQPKLILLDIMLPKLNGYDVLRKLKQNPKTAQIPIVVLTNRDTELNTCTELGASECIIKSQVSLSLLQERIRAYVFGNPAPVAKAA